MTNGEAYRLRRYLVPLAAAAFTAGIFLRFWDLGGAPLAVDEYFLGTSLLNTFAHGVPQFLCGGFYTRGLLIQYLSLPLLELGRSLEFTVRFWPAVTSILTIVAVWRIGLRAGGYVAASIAVVLISLSVWEVEFARFGRMYGPFQAIFLWYIYFQLEHLVRGRDNARWWYLSLSAIALLVYEGSAVLLALNFLALIWPGRRWSASHLVIAMALLVSGSLYLTHDFRQSAVTPEQLSPIAETSEASAPSLNLPIDMPSLPDSLLPIVGVGLLLVGLVLWLYRRRFDLRHPSLLFWAIATLSICFGLLAFGLALIAAGLLIRLPPPLRDLRIRRNHLLGWLAGLCVVWLGVLHTSFALGGLDPSASIASALRYVLDYPDVYYKVVLPWLQTIPLTTVSFAVLTAPVLWAVLNQTESGEGGRLDVVRYLLATVILLVLIVAILNQPYFITRYTYFLYPLIIVLASVGIERVTQVLTAQPTRQLAAIATLIAVLFGITEDFRLSHLIGINEPEFRYRIAYNDMLAEHYYARWDFRGVASHVNERIASNDSVIVFDQPLPHYLARTTAIFIREGTDNHFLVAACSPTSDRWSNAPLLDQDNEVNDLIARTRGAVWLLVRTPAYPFRDSLEVSLVTGLAPQFTSQDGHLAVYRLDSSIERL